MNSHYTLQQHLRAFTLILSLSLSLLTPISLGYPKHQQHSSSSSSSRGKVKPGTITSDVVKQQQQQQQQNYQQQRQTAGASLCPQAPAYVSHYSQLASYKQSHRRPQSTLSVYFLQPSSPSLICLSLPPTPISAALIVLDNPVINFSTFIIISKPIQALLIYLHK